MNKQFSGMVCVACVVIIVLCMSKAIPYGIVGNIASAKPYFILMALACVIGLPFAVLYQYRTQQEKDSDLERARVEMNILSKTAPSPRTLEREASSTQSRNTNIQNDTSVR